MDSNGKRTKYSERVKKFLRYAESLGVKYSDHLISDSIGIKEYLENTYGAASTYIAYGATLFIDNDVKMLQDYNLEPYEYDMLIARLEPENSIEIILDGVAKSSLVRPFLVVGNYHTPYGNFLRKKYLAHPQIQFLGSIYNIGLLNNLRYFSNIYFHGHTVGGTNPSLLEAMASSSLICANDNDFNKYILGSDAIYFKDPDQVSSHLSKTKAKEIYQSMLEENRKKIVNIYDWEIIVDQYANHFLNILKGY